MFKFTDEEKTFKDIVKEEVFRQYLVGNLLSLNEQERQNKITGVGRKARGKFSANQLKYSDVASELEDDEDVDTILTPDELVKNFNAKKPDEKKRLVYDVNSSFINNLSDNEEFVAYTLNKHAFDEEFYFSIMLYAIGKKDELVIIKRRIYTFYLDFLLDKFFKPTASFIGTKSALTGNKKVDKVVKNVIFRYFTRLLRSKYSFPKHYMSLDNKIVKFIKSHLDNVKDELYNDKDELDNDKNEINEGLINSINLSKLMFSVGFIFNFNKKTDDHIKDVLSGMKAEDLKDISKEGRSNTAILVTKGILKRVAEELVYIKIGGDPNLDKMLALMGYDLIRENSDLNDALENALEKIIQSELRQLNKAGSRLKSMFASL